VQPNGAPHAPLHSMLSGISAAAQLLVPILGWKDRLVWLGELSLTTPRVPLSDLRAIE
jgi:hypothetical protein